MQNLDSFIENIAKEAYSLNNNKIIMAYKPCSLVLSCGVNYLYTHGDDFLLILTY